MFKQLFTILLSIAFPILSFSQKTITAKISIDDYANLHISQELKSLQKDTLSIDKNILIHSKYAKLLTKETKNTIFYEPKKVDSIFYVVNPVTKKENNEYQANNNFFFTVIEYLAVPNSQYFDYKKFDLKFDLSKFKIIYPDNQDLKVLYRTTPPIIAGNFNQYKENSNIYYLKKDSVYHNKIKPISDEIDSAFKFYTSYFGEKSKPKIIFVPLFDGLEGRTFENLILFNSRMYFEESNKRIVAHELAHNWFGEGSLTFDKISTEGITDFLALQYLNDIENDKKYLDEVLRQKFYNSEGFKTTNDILDSKSKTKNFRISYNLIPIVLFTKQKNNPKFLQKFSKFYLENKEKRKATITELDNFLEKEGVEKIIKKDKFPDFFIAENSEVEISLVSCSSDKNYKVDIDIYDNSGNVSRKKISFTKNKNEKKINIKNISKIVIDPDYKIFQISRLNDVWIKSNKSLFNKNRYFTTDKINEKAMNFSNELLNYFNEKEKKDDLISQNVIVLNQKQKEEFNKIKLQYFFSTDISLTGASILHSIKNRTINMKIAYYNKETNNSDVIFIYLKTNNDINTIENFRTVTLNAE